MVVTNVPARSTRLDSGEVARATAVLVADIMRQVPLRRVGIAGGDTSSLAARALPIWGLSYLTALSPGVTVCRAHSDEPMLQGLELMLKGGQMGAPDLFERLVHGNAS